MKKAINSNRFFLLLLALLISTSLYILFHQVKGDFIILLNSSSSPFLNTFFKNITFFGDGFLIIAAGLIIALLVKIRIGFGILFGYIVSGVPIMIIKRIIDSPRPKAYLENFNDLILMDNYYYATTLSFPSGHTTTGFAFFIFLMMISEKNILKFIFLLLAILVGISRMYLLQHFLLDVTVGAIWGSIIAVSTYFYYLKWDNSKWNITGLEYFKSKK